MSVGILFDDNFRKNLEKIAKEKKCKIYLPSGAVCGIDGILSANVDIIDATNVNSLKIDACYN